MSKNLSDLFAFSSYPFVSKLKSLLKHKVYRHRVEKMWSNLIQSIAKALPKRNYCTPADCSEYTGSDGYKKWKKLTFLVALPCVGLSALSAFMAHQKQHEYRTRPKFVQYEYLRIRNKRYPWGDGIRTLFHNPELNALPSGYEK
ncbi:cytochrome c oxidase subunit 6A1, mitochondrial-like [Anopheles funestus]|uniref:cytochrome c oxidase subunit 6A1, mitochondrial-like n=1 Tax=Anopheles funestus TaxID=62324 RepID=UPI0020C5BC7E|nr:cytochrome c oxidase subunit 6A1, mitochondrial-like [Anopheles funestus]